MKARFKPYTLDFKNASGTSRGVLRTKDTYILEIEDDGDFGYGECALFKGLSVDDRPDYEHQLRWLCDHINEPRDSVLNALKSFPSIQFGYETALKSLKAKDPFKLFPSLFTDGTKAIPINGLVWMGDYSFMRRQIKEKIDAGFTCIKMKIGAINFDDELELLSSIRQEFSRSDIELRVDANGAFSVAEALDKLKKLSELDLHSIEQPIKQGQLEEMALLCEQSPLEIALDEELIGVFDLEEKRKVLSTINPQYIILKPALVGGFGGSEEWIDLAEEQQIGWWITSALESNIGLNAIAQWTYQLGYGMIQGLGTGSLFTNNVVSPLSVKNGNLHYNSHINWNFKF